MSPLKRKKLVKIRSQLDKLDNSLMRIIKTRTNLVRPPTTIIMDIIQNITINQIDN